MTNQKMTAVWVRGHPPSLPQAVFGVLSSIEGCQAFHDATFHTDIGPWYKRTKQMVYRHHIRMFQEAEQKRTAEENYKNQS